MGDAIIMPQKGGICRQKMGKFLQCFQRVIDRKPHKALIIVADIQQLTADGRS